MAAVWVVCDHLCRSGAPRGDPGRKETALKTNREPGPPIEGSATPTTPPHEREDRRPPFVRSRRDRVIAGVAGGLAERLGVDSVLIRLGFVVLSLAGGIGIAIYLVLFAISQEEGDAPERLRRGGGRQRTIATILVLAGALLVFRSLGLWFGDDLVWPVAIAAFGSAIIWVRADRAGRAWKPAFPRRASSSNGDGPSLSSISPVRLLIGAVLVAGGTAAFLAANISRGAIGTVVVAAAVTLSGLALIIGPWIMRLARQLSDERRERIRAEERQDVAAHLHDSVLQTLALIQRSEDPARMAALARVQERELRSWLYRPQGPQRGDLLSTAVDALAERIELAHRIPGRDRRRRRLPDRRRPPGRHGRLRRGADQRRQTLRRAAGVAVRRGRSGRGDGLRPGPGEGVRPGDRPRGPARHRRLDPRPAPAARWDRGGRLVAGRRHGGSAHAPEGRGVTGPAGAVRVFIVDDHRLFLTGVRAELGEAFEIVGEAADVDGAVARHRARRSPTWCCVDVHMPGGGGAAVVEAVGRTDPDVRFLALSASDAAEDVIGVIRSGARGYVTKTISPDDLVDATSGACTTATPSSRRAWRGSCWTPSPTRTLRCWTPSSTG